MAGTPRRVSIDAKDMIVGIAVSDLKRSKAWYSRLFGKEPDLEPFPGNVEYKVAGGWVQITKGKVKPSSWGLQIEVGDLAQERERLRNAKIDASEVRTVPGVISFFDLKDPDGNAMRWFQVLSP
jgi:glyoxylase I family protein